jgi:hypothetical protein
LPPHRFLNAVYAWVVSRMNAKQREEWDAMLLAPLPGRKQKPAAVAASGDSGFMDAMKNLKGGA